MIEQFARSLEAEPSHGALPAIPPTVDRTVATVLESITDAFVAFDRDWHYTYHVATVDTARLPLSLLDEVVEERCAGRKRQMIDVAVQGLIHAEHELNHSHFLSLQGISALF